MTSEVEVHGCANEVVSTRDRSEVEVESRCFQSSVKASSKRHWRDIAIWFHGFRSAIHTRCQYEFDLDVYCSPAHPLRSRRSWDFSTQNVVP